MAEHIHTDQFTRLARESGLHDPYRYHFQRANRHLSERGDALRPCGGEQILTALVWEQAELLRQASAESAKRAAGAAGVGALAIGPVPDVLANLALVPVLSRADEVVHALEVAGVIAGVLIGDVRLAMVCAKHLLYDEATNVLADTFAKAEAKLEVQVEMTRFGQS
jgi:hypothetical protein